MEPALGMHGMWPHPGTLQFQHQARSFTYSRVCGEGRSQSAFRSGSGAPECVSRTKSSHCGTLVKEQACHCDRESASVDVGRPSQCCHHSATSPPLVLSSETPTLRAHSVEARETHDYRCFEMPLQFSCLRGILTAHAAARRLETHAGIERGFNGPAAFFAHHRPLTDARPSPGNWRAMSGSRAASTGRIW